MSDIVIKAENLSKLYRIGKAESYKTLRDQLGDSFSRVLKREKQNSRDAEDTIWALKDLSFEIKRGEVVGIIGRNGAGKSTLLKILSRVTEPTRGYVDLRGKVCSLLEVGTGFHPELTGRENVYLNAAIMGMKKRDIDKRFDQIISFAEIEKFVDTPVKRFSSGMYTRLAFSVAAHLDPDIFLIDEVLAVGDAAFQKKCIGKVEGDAKSGRTILFVNHNLGQIRRLCQSAMWIENGQCRSRGPVMEVTSAYQTSFSTFENVSDSGSKLEGFLSWRIDGEEPHVIRHEKQVAFEILLNLKHPVANGHHGLILKNANGENITGWAFSGLKLGAGEHRLRYQIPGFPLRPGAYFWYASFWDGNRKIDAGSLLPELIIANPEYSNLGDDWSGVLNVPCQIEIKKG